VGIGWDERWSLPAYHTWKEFLIWNGDDMAGKMVSGGIMDWLFGP
jgi:hypothetical protein